MIASLICLTLNVYHEARGEPFDGQLAVVEVTLNRVSDPRWPDTPCEVVYQPDQFSWTISPAPVDEPEAVLTALEAVLTVMMGNGLGIEATHYHATTMQQPPFWATHYPQIGSIGNHRFYE